MKLIKTLFFIGVVLYTIWYLWSSLVFSFIPSPVEEELGTVGYKTYEIALENCKTNNVIEVYRNNQIAGYACNLD